MYIRFMSLIHCSCILIEFWLQNGCPLTLKSAYINQKTGICVFYIEKLHKPGTMKQTIRKLYYEILIQMIGCIGKGKQLQ